MVPAPPNPWVAYTFNYPLPYNAEIGFPTPVEAAVKFPKLFELLLLAKVDNCLGSDVLECAIYFFLVADYCCTLFIVLMKFSILRGFD